MIGNDQVGRVGRHGISRRRGFCRTGGCTSTSSPLLVLLLFVGLCAAVGVACCRCRCRRWQSELEVVSATRVGACDGGACSFLGIAAAAAGSAADPAAASSAAAAAAAAAAPLPLSFASSFPSWWLYSRRTAERCEICFFREDGMA